MGKVLQLAKYRSAKERQVVAQRGYSRFLARNHRKMQEAADKRKREEVLQEEQTVE